MPLLLQITSAAITVGVVYGTMKTSQAHAAETMGRIETELKRDIKRLEKKQDMHNHVVERLTKVETKVEEMQKGQKNEQ